MKLKNKENFDVLVINNHWDLIDMIQSFMGDACLGTFFQKDISKIYFKGGMKNQTEIMLNKLISDQTIKWAWETQVQENWHLSWKDHFRSIVIENKLAILPPWEADSHTEITIRIKPGMAFGTGHHETTWLMLQKMLFHVKPEMTVLDLGAGSGILSIAAWKMGASKIDSVENDFNCEDNFIENLELNKISDGILYHYGDVLNWNNMNHDIILANIDRKVLQKLIPKLINVKGKIILSGLLLSDYDKIKKICEKYEFKIEEQSVKGDWICLMLITS